MIEHSDANKLSDMMMEAMDDVPRDVAMLAGVFMLQKILIGIPNKEHCEAYSSLMAEMISNSHQFHGKRELN